MLLYMLVNVKSRRLLNHVKSLGRSIAHAHKIPKARGGVKGKSISIFHLCNNTFVKVVTYLYLLNLHLFGCLTIHV